MEGMPRDADRGALPALSKPDRHYRFLARVRLPVAGTVFRRENSANHAQTVSQSVSNDVREKKSRPDGFFGLEVAKIGTLSISIPRSDRRG